MKLRNRILATLLVMTLSVAVSSVFAADAPAKVVVIPLSHSSQGPVTSYLNVPFTAFTSPNDGLGALVSTGACWNNNGTILVYLQAPVMLPHGAVIKEVAVSYYYYAGDSRSVQLMRMSKTGENGTLAQVNCDDGYHGFSTATAISNATVDNENYTYFLYAYGFHCDRKHAVRWVRIKYESL